VPPGEDRDEGVLQLLKGRLPDGFLDDADFASDGGEQVERPEFEADGGERGARGEVSGGFRRLLFHGFIPPVLTGLKRQEK